MDDLYANGVTTNITVILNQSTGRVKLIPMHNWHGTNNMFALATDSYSYVASNRVMLTVDAVFHPSDLDHDGIPDVNDSDDDNDGVNDTFDTLTGNVSYISSNLNSLNLTVNNSNNITSPHGVLNAVLFNGTTPLVNFTWNFTNSSKLKLQNVSVTWGMTSYGYVIVRGIPLNGTSFNKTITLPRVNSSMGYICIKDAEVSSISQVSSGCTASDEVILSCPGTSGNYTCTNTSTLIYVSGLKHSAVVQRASYCGDGTCDSDESCSSCSTDCGACPSYSSGGGGGGGGGSTSLGYVSLNLGANEIKSASFNSEITKVSIASPSPHSNVHLSVSSSVSSVPVLPPGVRAYAIYDVSSTLPNAEISYIEFSFRVDKSWLTNKGLYSSDIFLYHYTTSWEKIIPLVIGEDNNYVYYSANPPSLSLFMIGGEQEQVYTPETSFTPSGTCYDGVMNGNELGVDCGGRCAPCKKESSTGQPETHKEKPPVKETPTPVEKKEEPVKKKESVVKGKNNHAPLIIGIVIILLAGLLIGASSLKSRGSRGNSTVENTNLPEPSNELERFIINMIKKGRGKEEIAGLLMKGGWKDKHFRETLDRIFALKEAGSSDNSITQKDAFIDEELKLPDEEINGIRSFGEECRGRGGTVHIIATASADEYKGINASLDGSEEEKNAYNECLKIAKKRARYLESLLPNHDESEYFVESKKGREGRYYIIRCRD